MTFQVEDPFDRAPFQLLREFIGGISSGPIPTAENLWLVLLPLTATLVGFLLRRMFTAPRSSGPPQSDPPDRLTPAELGLLLGRGGYTRRVAATLVDLAVRGHLSLQEVGNDRRPDYLLRFEKDSRVGFTAHELEWLEPAREARGHGVRLHSLQRWGTGSSSTLRESLIERGYFRSPPHGMRLWWVLLLFPCQIALVLIASEGWMTPSQVTAALLALAILCAFGSSIVRRTPRGVRAQEQALGFEKWLTAAALSPPRDQTLARQTFEHYLPYAIALGQEARWARAFTSQPSTCAWLQTTRGQPLAADQLSRRICRAVPQFPWKLWLHAWLTVEDTN